MYCLIIFMFCFNMIEWEILGCPSLVGLLDVVAVDHYMERRCTRDFSVKQKQGIDFVSRNSHLLGH